MSKAHSKQTAAAAEPFKFRPKFKARPVWATFDPAFVQKTCPDCGESATPVEVVVTTEKGVTTEKRMPEPCAIHEAELGIQMQAFALRYTPRLLTEEHGKLAIARILEPLNDANVDIKRKGEILLAAMLKIFDGWRGLITPVIAELCSEFYEEEERDRDEALLRLHCEGCSPSGDVAEGWQPEHPAAPAHWHEAAWDPELLNMLIEHGRNFFGIAKSLVEQVAATARKKEADRKNERSSGPSGESAEATETIEPGKSDSTPTPGPSVSSSPQGSETS